MAWTPLDMAATELERTAAPECPVCYNDPTIPDANHWVALVPCGHCLHKSCIDDWIRSENKRLFRRHAPERLNELSRYQRIKYTCPVCRFNMPCTLLYSERGVDLAATKNQMEYTWTGYVSLKLDTEKVVPETEKEEARNNGTDPALPCSSSSSSSCTPSSSSANLLRNKGSTVTEDNDRVRELEAQIESLQDDLLYADKCREIMEDTHLELANLRDEEIRLLKSRLGTYIKENEILRERITEL